MKDLQFNLERDRITAPGEDGIYYLMIKNLPENAKQYLCKLLNKFFKETYFPEQWTTAIIVPIPKPGKSHNLSTNYRPTALTSCLCKTFEKIINERLLEYLEMHNGFTNIQCGGRKQRSVMNHLVRLENEVRKSFALNEHMLAVFFDLEKAYDMRWRYGIIRDWYKTGLRGCLPNYIREFLKTRKFQVRVGSYLSNTGQQNNCVSQGSILSVTLFAFNINSIAQHIPSNPRFLASLYVDDLQLAFRHSDLQVIETKMQQCLPRIQQWTELNGFKFSKTKTKVMHFTTVPGLHINKPVLYIDNSVISYTERK